MSEAATTGALIARDPLPRVRIFLASSRDRADERSAYESMIHDIAARPNIARSYQLDPVTWQSDGGPVDDGLRLQEAIFKNAGFDDAEVILVLIGQRIGPGTLQEYERAAKLKREHGSRPVLLMYFLACKDGVSLAGGTDITGFHEKVIRDALCVPTNYRSIDELRQKLTEQLETLLVGVDGFSGGVARSALRRFHRSVAALGATSLVSLLCSQTMGFPDIGVTYLKVMVVIFVPPVLFLLGVWSTWEYRRLLQSFRSAWRSFQCSDAQLLDDFAAVIPALSWPRTPAAAERQHWLSTLTTTLLLVVAFVLPVAVVKTCLFDEFLQWDFVVAPDELTSDSIRPEHTTEKQHVKSRWIQRRPLQFPYSLSEPAVRDRRQLDDALIFVYAEGVLGDLAKAGTPAAFRVNMGPQVFLPWQPLAYLLMWLVQIGLALFAISSLLTMRRSLRPAATGSGSVASQSREAVLS